MMDMLAESEVDLATFLVIKDRKHGKFPEQVDEQEDFDDEEE